MYKNVYCKLLLWKLSLDGCQRSLYDKILMPPNQKVTSPTSTFCDIVLVTNDESMTHLD
jgi:hypothetical protein